ncbi:MAG: hypothetical protein IT430_16790 [Phycisphaerales bacterium]|nr:hypothetical protein [Phycisphaerales bacterium]
MREQFLLTLVATWLSLIGSAALAQSDSTRNAAMWYERAFEQLEQFTPEEMEAINNYRSSPGQPPSPEVRALLNRAAPIVDNVIRASQQGYSDFGLDYSQGFDMLLPHLGPMRNLARLVQADSAMRLHDGDGIGAAERIGALYRIADQAGDDRILISSLVGRAVFEVAEQSAEMGFDRGAFDPAAASVLLKATRAFDQDDPFQTLDAILMEQTLCVDMMRDHFLSGDPEKRSEILTDLASDAGLGEQLAQLSPEEIETSLNQYSDLMEQFVVAFSQEDREVARAQLDAIAKGFETGEYGLVAQILTPALGRVYDLTMEGKDKLHARIELLEGVTRGEVDVRTLTNAAVWYRRGIEQLPAIDDAWKQAIRTLDAAKPLEPERLEALGATADSIRGALDCFVTGSTIPRCDFATERDPREMFVPRYADGMRDGFALLIIEALRLAAGGDIEASAQMLAAAFRINAHLSDDHLLVSALVAREGFLRAAQAAAGVEQRHHFSEAAREELAAAIRRCGPGDPFGFVGAMSKCREYVHKSLIMPAPGETRELREARLQEWLSELDADALIYLMAMADVLDYDLSPREPFNRDGAARLGDYLLAETMDLAAIDAPALASLCQEGRPEAFQIPETAQLVGASTRMAGARSEQWPTITWALQRAPKQGDGAAGESARP